MCGRFSQSKSAETLSSAFQLAVPSWTPRYNIAPTQAIPTASVHPSESEPQFRLMRWGLVPSWSKDLLIGTKLINARAETVAEKPLFRSAFKQRRCLILADGFYEWKRLNGKNSPSTFRLLMVNRLPLLVCGSVGRGRMRRSKPARSLQPRLMNYCSQFTIACL